MFYMANIAYRRKRKNNTGSYDTVYYETDSRIVIRPNGESVEDSLKKTILSSEKNQPNGIATLNDNGVLDINMGGTGAKIAQEAIYNLGARPNKNLFINADFRNPVNHRGQLTYTSGKCIDMCGLDVHDGKMEMSIQDDCIKLTQIYTSTEKPVQAMYITAPIENFTLGQTITISALFRGTGAAQILLFGGTVIQDSTIAKQATDKWQLLTKTFKLPDNISTNKISMFLYADISGQNRYVEYMACKCEYGNNQTLARKLEDGTWELLETSDYHDELTKCQRYILNFTPDSINVSYIGVCSVVNNLVVNIPLPVQMRLKRPSLVWDISNVVVEHKGEKKPVNSAFIAATSSNSITIVLNVSGVEVGDVGNLQLSTNDDQQQWIIDASL